MGYGLIIALLLSVMAAALIFHLMRKVVPLLLHGALGLAFFWLLNYLGILKVPIDIVTFLIAAIGGVFGVAIVLVLAFFGVPL